MSNTKPVTNATFDGLAFPVARVTYSSNSGNCSATIVRGSDRIYRARVSYDHAIGGSRNAVRAAEKAFEKVRADLPVFAREEYVAIPGDLNNGAYVFTFVPRHFFGED
jgi:hypothetical protein